MNNHTTTSAGTDSTIDRYNDDSNAIISSISSNNDTEANLILVTNDNNSNNNGKNGDNLKFVNKEKQQDFSFSSPHISDDRPTKLVLDTTTNNTDNDARHNHTHHFVIHQMKKQRRKLEKITSDNNGNNHNNSKEDSRSTCLTTTSVSSLPSSSSTVGNTETANKQQQPTLATATINNNNTSFLSEETSSSYVPHSHSPKKMSQCVQSSCMQQQQQQQLVEQQQPGNYENTTPSLIIMHEDGTVDDNSKSNDPLLHINIASNHQHQHRHHHHPEATTINNEKQTPSKHPSPNSPFSNDNTNNQSLLLPVLSFNSNEDSANSDDSSTADFNMSRSSSNTSLDNLSSPLLSTSHLLHHHIHNHSVSPGEAYHSTLKSLENILPPFFTPCVPPHSSFNYYSEHYWGEHPLSLDSFSPILHLEKKSSLTIVCKYTPTSSSATSPRRERPTSQRELIEDEIYCLKISLDKSSIPLLERDAEISRFLTRQLLESDHSSMMKKKKKALSIDPVITSIKAYLADYCILVREYVDGVSLRTFIDRTKLYARAEPITEENFDSLTDIDTTTVLNEDQRVEENIKILGRNLNIAIALCSSIAQLHHSRVCHADIKPENIICVGKECNIRMIDFGRSTFLPLEHPFVYSDKLIGTPMYCSPEATGKIPKPLGFHSDVYSLGFVLYELFSKDHPFTKFKVSDFIFHHLTQQPETLFQNLTRRSFILENERNLFTAAAGAISKIITKAIQKSIENRYLSIFGLRRDLMYIRNIIHLKDIKALESFEAGMNDVQTTLSIPFGVYGREDILQKMELKLENMIESSEPTIVLLGGYSGIGKTSIVKEFRNRSKSSFQYFESKYDQHTNVPYFAIISICRQIVGDVLGESESVIKNFRFQLGTLINSDQLEMLIDAIPDLSCLFATTSFVKKKSIVGREQHDERMKLFSQGIIHLFSVYTHLKKKRLCIFLDDLQWTDFDSMKLLKEVLGTGSCDTIPLLIIGAFRNNEVGKDHPLLYFLDNLKLRVNIEEIEVNELTEDQSNMIVSESLRKKTSETEKLTKILFSRTNGNPFFLKQLLAALVKEGAIYFDTKKDTLTWDYNKLEKVEYSQNVVDFLLGHLERLPKETRDILAFASCFGNRFSNEDMLMLLNRQSKEDDATMDMMQLKEVLNYAVKEGWISNYDSSHLQFNHDRLQQAAYESLPTNKRLNIHYEYGKQRLAKAQQDGSLDENLFDIVIQLNHKHDDPQFLENREERRLLVELNNKSAKKALQTSSTDKAISFISIARKILEHEENCWTETYRLAFDSLLIAGNCHYSTNIELATSLFMDAIQKSNNKTDLYEACNHALMAYLSQGKYEQVYQILVNHVFTTIDELNFLVRKDNTAESLTEWILNKMNFFKENILGNFSQKSDIMNLPDLDLENMEKWYLIMLLTQSCPAIYHMNDPLNKHLFMIMVLISAEMIFTHGLTPLSPLAITLFAWSWCNFEFYPQMHMFLDAGVELEKTRFKNEHELASCLLMRLMSYYFAPNVNPLEVWNMSEEAFLLAVKSKNKHFGGFSILWYPFHHLFYSHGDLKTSIGLSLNSIEIFKRNGNLMLMDASKMILEMKYVLSGDVDRFQPNYVCNVKEYPFFRQMHYCYKAIALYFQNEIQKSFKCIAKSYDFRDDSVGLCVCWIDLVFQGLISAMYLRSATTTENIEKAEEILQYSISRLETISKANSSVFIAPLEFIRAEKLFSEYYRTGVESTRKIIFHYKKSFDHAEKERNQFLSRLIYLRMGEFYESLGMDEGISGNYFLRAMDSFEQFGASIIVDYILNNYSKHIDGYSSFSNRNPEQVFSSTSLSDESDHTLSGVTRGRISESTELDFREIFISILPILSEQTLSPRCCLILKRDTTVYIDAEYNADLNSIEALSSIKQFENSDLDKFSDTYPLKMIHRTLRTRTEQQLGWNNNEREYYFTKNTVASALCVPIIQKKTVIGCVYLENRETKDLFTVDKVNLAKLIISISLDNASIFTSINKSYARFLPAEFLKLLGKSHVTKVRLGDAVSREMTVLFSDIYGFTEIMEGLSAKDGFAFINLLLKSIAPPISRNGGFIDKILGDGILALFVEPQGAITAALEMISELEVFNAKNNTHVKLGIGLHHGILQLGTIGYEQRLDATVISDTVNVASRCESLTRTFHSNLLVTMPVMESITLPPDVLSTEMGKFIMKGKQIPHQIFNITSKSWKGIGNTKEYNLVTQVIDLFSNGEFSEAYALSDTILKNTKNNTIISVVSMYKEASTVYNTVVLPSDWRGEIRLSKDGEVRPFFSK